MGVVGAVVPSATSWSPPMGGVFKINTDAHVSNAGFVGLGVVIRDFQGRVVVIGVRRRTVQWPATYAEAAACFGVGVAAQLGLRRVVVESDAINVIRALKNETWLGSSVSLL